MTQLLHIDFISGYVTSLMTETFASMEASVDATSPHQPPVSCLPEIQPPPLCSNFVHPEKSEAVQHFRSRFRRKETPVQKRSVMNMCDEQNFITSIMYIVVQYIAYVNNLVLDCFIFSVIVCSYSVNNSPCIVIKDMETCKQGPRPIPGCRIYFVADAFIDLNYSN